MFAGLERDKPTSKAAARSILMMTVWTCGGHSQDHRRTLRKK
jgi:hypothetical protein